MGAGSSGWRGSKRKVAELGHVGIRCFDVEKQLKFYTEVLGLLVTDHDPRLGIYFLSARPDNEHHELLLAKGRDVAVDGKLIQQISFRCETFEDVVGLYRQESYLRWTRDQAGLTDDAASTEAQK